MDDLKVEVPVALDALEVSYGRIATLLAALGTESELAAHAEFAEELVRTSAMGEDAKEQALYPFLVEIGKGDTAERMQLSARHVGEAMVPLFRAVRHSVPIDVHKADPVGFERDLEHFVLLLKAHLAAERAELFPSLERLSDEETHRAAAAVEAANRHALEHPLPPHNPVARWLTRIEEHVDHIADTSEQYRPGRQRLAS